MTKISSLVMGRESAYHQRYNEGDGVTLSEKEAQLVLQEKNQALREQQRIEFGASIVPKLIQTFCDSPYIYQDNYVDSIVRLVEIFYLYKNESMDQLTDDELLAYMKKQFDGECQGSFDYLEETVLERIAREARRQSHQFLQRHLTEDYDVKCHEDEENEWDEE